VSAICGLLTKRNNINSLQFNTMFAELGKFPFDNSLAWQQDSIFLGCHYLSVVPDSVHKILPFFDSESSLTITADAIIDNREELFGKLDISQNERISISDSVLILKAYQKWGVGCPREIIGDFAFAIWDDLNKQLFVTTDHIGKRALYYYYSDELFAFSTLINPLFKIEQIKKEPNESFIAEYLAAQAIGSINRETATVYKDILQLPASTSLLVWSDGIKSWRYWQPDEYKPIRFASDAQYEAAFLKVFTEAVKCRMRGNKKLGIMLSGGLDSGAIATIVAKELQPKDQLLFGYTQVPMPGYRDKLPKSQMADERSFVEELCHSFPNIIPSYIASEQKSPLSVINRRLEILEQPYKNFQNSHWLDEIHRTAGLDNIGILLDGQSGNGSVSCGDLNSYIATLLEHKKYLTCYKTIKKFARHNKRPLLRGLAGHLYQNLPVPVKMVFSKLRGNPDYNRLLSLVNPDFEKMMKNSIQVRKNFFVKNWTAHESRMQLLGSLCTGYLGANETKIAMAYGITRRDPTRDKRVIEFCMNIPEDQWVRDGLERRLIRVAMKGILPDKYRLNTTVRGKQAADWLQRIAPEWSKACEEIATIGDFKLERKYLDIAKIKDRLAKNREIDPEYKENFDIWLLIRALIFARFLRKNFPENQ